MNKLCTDCKYHAVDADKYDSDRHICQHENNRSLVDGKPYFNCAMLRMSVAKCDTNATWFEQKETK